MVNTKRSLAKLICLLCGIVGVTAIHLAAYYVSQETALSIGRNLLSGKAYVMIIAFSAAAVAALLGRVLNKVLSGLLYVGSLAVMLMHCFGVVLGTITRQIALIPRLGMPLYMYVMPMCMLPALGVLIGLVKRFDTRWFCIATVLAVAPAAFCALYYGNTLYILPTVVTIGLVLLSTKLDKYAQAPGWLFLVAAVLAIAAVGGYLFFKYKTSAGFAERASAILHPGAQSGLSMARQGNLIGASMATVKVGSSLMYAGDHVTLNLANAALSIILNLGWIPFAIACVCHVLIGVSLILMARECRDRGVRYTILAIGIYWLVACAVGTAGDVLRYSSVLTMPLSGIYLQVVIQALFLGMCCGMFASDIHLRCTAPEAPAKTAEEAPDGAEDAA